MVVKMNYLGNFRAASTMNLTSSMIQQMRIRLFKYLK